MKDVINRYRMVVLSLIFQDKIIVSNHLVITCEIMMEIII